MSYDFRTYCDTLKKVNTALNSTPIKLDTKDLTIISQYLQNLIKNEESRLTQTGWKQNDITDLKEKGNKFWNNYRGKFTTDPDFFNYSFNNEMHHFQKMWSFNQFFGILYTYLEKPNQGSTKTTMDEPYSKLFLLQNLYLGFYENFQEYLSYFLKKIYKSEINPVDGEVVKGGLIYRVFFRQYCKFRKYDETFDYQMRNWIAHHSFIIKNDRVCVLYYSKKPEVKLNKRDMTLDEVNRQLTTLASVTIILMTLFDHNVFDIMTNTNAKNYEEMAKYFKIFFSYYFESWELFGKLK